MVLGHQDAKRRDAVIGVLGLIGLLLGVVAAFTGRWMAEGLAGERLQRAVVTDRHYERQENQLNELRVANSVDVRTPDGHTFTLDSGSSSVSDDQVSLGLSSLTNRVLWMRADGVHHDYHLAGWKIVLMPAGVLALLIACAVLVATRRRHSPNRGLTALWTILPTAAIGAFVVLWQW